MATGEISGTFTVYAPNLPSLYEPNLKIDPAGPSAPQYIEGTWNNESAAQDASMQYVFLQGPQNPDLSYPVSGTYIESDNWGDQCNGSLTGTLSPRGILAINVGPDGCGGVWSEEWLVLNSGDATSQGWFSEPGYCTPPADFPNGLGWSCSDVPLLKDQTDIPSTESPTFLGWVPSLPTEAAWQRTLPKSADGIVEFAGRFAFEQIARGGGGVDGCYNASNGSSPYPAFTTVTGGSWYVNSGGVWGSGWEPTGGGTNLLYSDDIGIPSVQVDWYQAHVPPCVIVLQQTMFIDSLNGPVAYNTGSPYQATSQLEIDINATPPEDECVNGSNVATVVTPNGGNPASACETYP